MSYSTRGVMNRRQTTTCCALASTIPGPSPLPSFTAPGGPALDVTPHRRTSSPGTIPLSSPTARKPSRLGPSRMSEAGSTASSTHLPTVACTSSPSCTASPAGKPSVVQLRATSAHDRPASWSIHAFDASSACSTPASYPDTPAAQTPAGAPAAPDSACPSALSSASPGQPLASPCHPAGRRHTVSGATSASGRGGVLRRLLHGLLGRLSCMARSAVVA